MLELKNKGCRYKIGKHHGETGEDDTRNLSDERERSKERMRNFWKEKRKNQIITELPMMTYERRRRMFYFLERISLKIKGF